MSSNLRSVVTILAEGLAKDGIAQAELTGVERYEYQPAFRICDQLVRNGPAASYNWMGAAEGGVARKVDLIFGIYLFVGTVRLVSCCDLEGYLADTFAFAKSVGVKAYSKRIDVVGCSFHRRIERRHVAQGLRIPAPPGHEGQVTQPEMSLHPHRVEEGLGNTALCESFREGHGTVPGRTDEGRNTREVFLHVLALELVVRR